MQGNTAISLNTKAGLQYCNAKDSRVPGRGRSGNWKHAVPNAGTKSKDLAIPILAELRPGHSLRDTNWNSSANYTSIAQTFACYIIGLKLLEICCVHKGHSFITDSEPFCRRRPRNSAPEFSCKIPQKSITISPPFCLYHT